MEEAKPGRLAKVWALARDLEDEPLQRLELFRSGLEGKVALLVVRLDEILENCARLPQGDACVGVLDGWESM